MTHPRKRKTRPVIQLGPCCFGDCTEPANVIVALPVKCLVRGHGWGCFACGLDSDGASAVLCEECAQRIEEGDESFERIERACKGYPSLDGRCARAELTEPHLHLLSGHPECDADSPGVIDDTRWRR